MSDKDPTLLHPPIVVQVTVHLSGEEKDRALDHVNTLHGRPEGIPLDEEAPEALLQASYALTRVRQIRLLITAIDKNGNMTFALAPEMLVPWYWS